MHPTRHEQARAILDRKARRMANEILGRRATGSDDFAEAFTLEWVDLVAEVTTVEHLMALGRNVVGPRDGLYVLDDGGVYRVYLQEKGVSLDEAAGLGFEAARDAAIERLLQLNGIPWRPPGR